MDKHILMDETGALFMLANGRPVPFAPDGPEEPPGLDALLRALRDNPHASFFKTPFHRIAYTVDGRLEGMFPLTPGDFNPGSPFDAIQAVRSYLSEGKLLLPRLYLYPTATCNSSCALCQFHSRHRTGGSLTEAEWRRALDIFARHRGSMRSQSLIISGDGEPLTHPDLEAILETAQAMETRIFLTSNLLLPFTGNETLYRRIAESCHMITVSIKGLTPEAYACHQGLPGFHLQQVFSNLEMLASLRAAYGRDKECMLGVASLILPENSRAYLATIDRLAGMGVDYLYLNQVEPSLEKWGIEFSGREQNDTLRQLAEYGECPHPGMMVRCAANPFVQRHGETVYYDAAALRDHPDICGSALFNPLVLSSPRGMIWSACRNGDLFDDEAFRYATDGDGIQAASIATVMRAASRCHACRLERQVKHFDRIVDIERRHRGAAKYHLVFDAQRLLEDRQWFVSFDQVVA